MFDYFPSHDLPFSLVFFVIALVVVALQMAPIPGIFLMVVAGGFWTAILINLGLLGLVLEAATGRIAPVWLVVPAVWYGLYAVAVLIERGWLAAERRRFDVLNGGVRIPFDPQREDLVVEVDQSDYLASELLRRHDVDVVYSRSTQRGVTRTSARRIIPADAAKEISPGYDVSGIGVSTRPIPVWRGKRSGTSTTVSELVYPEEPSRPAVRLVPLRVEREKRGSLTVVCTPVDIYPVGERLPKRIVAAEAAPLRKFPMFVAGGFLDSGAPAWRRYAGFLRTRPVPLVAGTTRGTGARQLVGRALGLSPIDPEDHRPSDPEPLRALVAAIEAEATAAELEDLDARIAAPQLKPRRSSFPILTRRPGLWADRAGAMLAVMECEFALEKRWSPAGREFASLLARLPERDLQPLKARLIAFYAPPFAEKDWRKETHALLARLGALGLEALPILMEGFSERAGQPHAETWALEALCRIGAPARAAAGDAVLAVWNTRPQPPKEITGDTCRWVYLVLMRLGMKEEAGPVEQHHYGAWFRKVYETVGPDSPAGACSIRS